MNKIVWVTGDFTFGSSEPMPLLPDGRPSSPPTPPPTAWRGPLGNLTEIVTDEPTHDHPGARFLSTIDRTCANLSGWILGQFSRGGE
eukprot:9014312-Pyramimonas_sp.AAC.1